ncbi:MAG: polysaccharide deacetylase family protein [Planctomycetota bacterium]|jgi:peptidoglycan/xylan/chitin deacetylase (PgdA/CDA1 family)/SAM-dependent methyltransferase
MAMTTQGTQGKGMNTGMDMPMVSVFDTSICDNNLGNHIIMEAVNEQLEQLFPSAFFIRLPYLDPIGPQSARYVQESSHVFLGGTNALSSEMEHYRQWGLDPVNCEQIPGVVLMGVGWWQYQGEVSPHTRNILRKVLHPERIHSVRDSYTREKLRSIGCSNVVVTGCPSMWCLSEAHCQQVPVDKAQDVLLTFTNYNQHTSDETLFQVLQAHYRNVYVWVQGPEDLAYARRICGDHMNPVAPSLRSLDRLLASHPSLDYVGTRLHAGIRAIASGRRSLIIGIDNRAIEMGRDFDLPVLERSALAELPALIEASQETRVQLPHQAIATWKQQFAPAAPAATPATPAPVSRAFGFDRGQPIDRHYIERFLRSNQGSIHGRVLEVADGSYAHRFGTDVSRVDILNAEPAPEATVVGDLAAAGTLPHNTFDCIILTQTLNVVYDPRQAIVNAVEALVPGGTLLITVPGISQISRYDMDRWGDYWRFTDRSLRRLLAESVPRESIEITAHGNVAVAKAFLDGLAADEVDPALLEQDDSDYQLLLTARVVKPVPTADVMLQPVAQPTMRPLVLIYHRVADDPIDSQLMAVSPAHFATQMAVLAEHHRVVPLAQLLTEAESGGCPPRTVALTFDDGYADVLANGVPVLEQHGLHATVFITSGMVGSTQEFWWDALERILLTGAPLPPFLNMLMHGQQVQRATATPSERVALHAELWATMRSLPPAATTEVVDGLFRWAGIEPLGRLSHRVVTTEQLRQLAASPAIEIGAHTVSHPSLSALPLTEQQHEIERSRSNLETLLDQPVRYFSYPYGSAEDFTQDTASLVAAAGFEAGIANVQDRVGTPLERYAVPRRLVRNWSGPQFATWLQAEDMGQLEQSTLAEREHRLMRHLEGELQHV